ncbi:Probable calcium-binding protein CML25 (Calmodulin-like protein 25) [Durusdinium trenchii]|uniref:Probable calcium-binding protein CML25 (Calmodulin-like protein 25) n=1 Tax=Durusdinium trenchii TaxID=1381693 RepID=A0ABP0SJG2_9DINO
MEPAETQRPERPASPTSPTSPISPTSNKTKEIFQRWDVHGTGVITRRRLQELLTAVAGKSVTEEEIERCIAEADKNGNGIIEYNEFIEWLQQPCGTVRLGSHGLEYFDLEACVRPLYDVYDQDGDGLVSMEEFIGCQSILQNSLGLKSKVSLEEQFKKEFGRPGTTSVPLLESEPKKTFLMVDSDKSRSISFKEFLEWQRKQLIAARTPSKELEELLPALARQLKRVFKFEEEEEMNACDGRVLQRIVDNLAKFCIEIWSEKEGAKQKAKPMLALTGKARHYTNRWSEPPVGLNTKKLKAKYLATESCMTSGRLSENMDLDLMVIPEVLDGDDENPRNRVWLGQIIQKVTMRDGKVRSDEPVYYEFISLSWSKTADAVFKFHRSYDAMPPELRFFSLLKAEADFGNKLTWSQIQRVFARCKSHGILTAAQHAEYNNAMELRVHKALKEEDLLTGLSTEEIKQKVQENLPAITQRPQDTMALLSDLDVFQVSSVWADFMTQ